MAAAAPGHNLVHYAILYAVMQNETAPGVRVGEPYDCTNELPIARGLPYLVASHQSPTSPSDQLWAAVDAALPLGKGMGKYVVLEVHFDNVNGVKGATDSTGFEVRRYEMDWTESIRYIFVPHRIKHIPKHHSSSSPPSCAPRTRARSSSAPSPPRPRPTQHLPSLSRRRSAVSTSWTIVLQPARRYEMDV